MDTNEDQEKILQTQNLTKRFGKLTAVNNLNLNLTRGEIFGFLGPNGAGKSTSINMVCGLLKPDEGQIIYHGKPLRANDTATLARIGVCPQNIIIWQKLTCLEQLVFSAEMYGVEHSMARTSSLNLLNELGLIEKKNTLASNLSGGMQRRLNIAMALVHDPEIVIFDEPEAGLDPQSRVLVRDYVRSLALKKTVIFTTHNMDEAERTCDRVAIIDHGNLLVEDTPEVLKNKIGKGDVLEFEIVKNSHFNPDEILKTLKSIIPDTVIVDYMVLMRSLNMVSHLPAVIEALKDLNTDVKELKLRGNTLEDVFIALTGKKLRQ